MEGTFGAVSLLERLKEEIETGGEGMIGELNWCGFTEMCAEV